jgi:hypothetical protein
MLKRKAKHSGGGRSSAALPVVICAVVALALAAGGFAIASTHHRARSASLMKSHLASSATSSTAPGPTAPPAPLRVLGITPKGGARAVGFGTDITISFSSPVKANGVLPELEPATAGSWTWATPEKLVFRPDSYFAPFAHVKLTVPGGPSGFASKQGMQLQRSVKSSFAVKAASTLRLQQLLAELGYLPVRFVPGSPSAPGAGSTAAKPPQLASGQASLASDVRRPTKSSTNKAGAERTLPAGPPAGGATAVEPAPPPVLTTVDEPATPSAIPLAPVPGSFAWRFGHLPTSLVALWAPGRNNTITTGAVMQFELAEGLPTDGQAGPKVWTDLLRAVAHRQINRSPYDYVYVNTGSPEYVSVWRDGAVVFKTLANTGIPQAPTAAGTWPVYARYLTTTMSGTNPNGSHYSDPGIPWVSYFNGGDALHGFLRASYGFPQSLGCVEMPYSSAHTVFPFTPIGTLVTVL